MNHVSSCEACRSQLASEQKTGAAVEALRADLSKQVTVNHPTYEELAGCVDESLGETDRITLETPLGILLICARELAAWRAFKAESTTYPEVERSPPTPKSLVE